MKGRFLVTILGRNQPGEHCQGEVAVKAFLSTWFTKTDGEFVKTKVGYKYVCDGKVMAQIVKV